MNLGGTIRLNRVGIFIIIAACILLMIYISTNGIEDIKNENGKNTNSINLRRLLIAAIEVAEKGGNEVISVKNTKNLDEKSKGKTKEGVDELFTKADSKSHCIMFYSLKHSFPKIKIISEEGSTTENYCNTQLYMDLDLDPNVLLASSSLSDAHVPAEDVTVWIDPLDATKEYTENFVQYVSTMVCVAVKGQPIIGVIHKPFDDVSRTSWAWVNNGISSNLKHTDSEVGDNNGPPVHPKIIVSMSHAGQVKNISEKAFGQACEIISAAGAGYKSLEVASKNATAYLHTTAIKKWDICAGNAILKALGGKMTTLTGSELDYSSEDKTENAKGLLATLENHDWFLKKLGTITDNPVSAPE